jgi:hypothetical protein
MKFCLCFAHFCVCVGEIFSIFIEFLIKMKKVTNTFKLRHKNEQNTNKNSCLEEEEFHTPPSLSL